MYVITVIPGAAVGFEVVPPVFTPVYCRVGTAMITTPLPPPVPAAEAPVVLLPPEPPYPRLDGADGPGDK